MLDIDFSGLENFVKDIDEAIDVATQSEIPFNKLFTPQFMVKHTKFSTIDEMIDKFGYTDYLQEKFDAIPDSELDAKVSEYSDFVSFEEMKQVAREEMILP